MKNVFLKSFVIFIVMSILNIHFTDWTVKLLKLPGGNFGMLSIAILIECLIVIIIGMITVLIFKKHYSSLFRIAVLFEVLYVLGLIISRANPFLYFFKQNDESMVELLLYVNSFITFLIVYLFDMLYSKIIMSKTEN
jgi:hypothetical protein